MRSPPGCFFAHVWAYTIAICPSSVVRPSTVAQNFMAGRIFFKLGRHVPWPKRVGRFFRNFDPTPGSAAILDFVVFRTLSYRKPSFVIYRRTVIARIPKFTQMVHLVRLHQTYYRFDLWPTFKVTEVKLRNFKVGWHVSLLFGLEGYNLV